MATIKEATEKFTREFLIPYKQIYGVGHFPCSCCDKPYIEVTVDKNIDKTILNKIPNKYMGFRVEKKFGEQTVAQKTNPLEPSDSQKNKFKKSFEGKEHYVINITKKGTHAIMNAPTIGGYIPEDIGILMEVMNLPKNLKELRQSERKYQNLEGLLIYLHTKGLISINGITSPKANDFSNIDGDDFSNARGRRRVSPRRYVVPHRVAPRRSSPRSGAKRHVNYVRRNYNRFYSVPYAVTPVAYVFDVQNPKKIRITKKGLEYIKRHNKGAYPLLLTAIKNGMVYNEVTLKNSLKLGDWNRVVSWLYGNKMIDFV